MGMRKQLGVRFDSAETPIGKVFVALSDRGVCDVTLGGWPEDRYRRHLATHAMQVHRDREAVAPTLSELQEYFAGIRNRFSVAVDLRTVTPFAVRVLRTTAGIPFGRTRSYGEIAQRINAPRASRAVGGALSRNPVPIIVPCHRVVAQDDRLGGFTGGLTVKRTLLRLEGCVIGRDRRSAV